MENTLIDTEVYKKAIEKSPSILRQIMDEVDELDEGSKKLLLLSLRKKELSKKYKMLDSEIAKSGFLESEEKIDELVSNTRKNMYDHESSS